MIATPYPELRLDITATIAAFAKWTAEVDEARREYELHPFARCGHGGRCARAYARRKAARNAH